MNKNNKSKSLENLSAAIKLISNKKAEIRDWNAAIPTLNYAEEDIDWQIRSILALPDEKINTDTTERTENLYNYWKNAIQDPSNLYPANTSANAINGTVSSGIYNMLVDSDKRTYNRPQDQQQISTKINLQQEYQHIQNSRNVKGTVSSKLESIKQIKPTTDKQRPIGDLFDEALSAVEHAKACTGTMSAAGIEMRNVLEQFKGTLYYRSSASKGGMSDKDRWKKMADYLAKNGVGSPEHTALLNEFKTYERLQLDSSELAKRKREAVFDSSDFDSLVTVFLNHLTVVLDLIDLDKLSY